MSSNLNSVTVDDGDPAITYQGAWQKAGVVQEYDSTTHGSNSPGSMFTFSFNGEVFSFKPTI